MKKIAMSLATIAMVLTFAVGATGAYFTDTKALGQQTFATGTLQMQVGQPSYQKMVFDNLKPGDHVRKYVTVQNTGTLDIDYLTVSKVNVSDPSGLLGQIKVSVEANISGVDGAFFTPDWTGGATVATWFNNSNVLDTPSYYRTPAGVIHPGQSYVLSFTYTVPTTLDNAWQGKTATFDVEFNAEQSHTGAWYF
jgi:hypothetical protein